MSILIIIGQNMLHPPPAKTIAKSMLSTYGYSIFFGGVVGATLGCITAVPQSNDVATCVSNMFDNTALGFLIGGVSAATNLCVIGGSMVVGFIVA